MEGLDDLIERLLEGRKCRGKRIQINESEIRQLCITAKDVFMGQPNLLELGAPINVCGKNFHFPFMYLYTYNLQDCEMSKSIIIFLMCRRYTWTVFRPASAIRIWGVSPRLELPTPGRLRG